MSNNINQLLQGAAAQGELTGPSMQALQLDNDFGAQIQNGMGLTPDDVPSAEVVLVTMMPDDSGSIKFAGNAQAVRDGHNHVLDALGAAKQQADVLVHNRYLNGHVLYPYTRVDAATKMSSRNYNPNQGTPLYDQTVVLLGTVLAKTQEFEDCGVPVRSVTLIITDGGDCHSRRQSATTVRGEGIGWASFQRGSSLGHWVSRSPVMLSWSCSSIPSGRSSSPSCRVTTAGCQR